MNKPIILALFIVSLVLLPGCDLFFVDEEIRDIAKSGDYSDCAGLDTSEDKKRIDKCYSYVGKRQDDPNACAAASGNYRDDCYEDVAVDLHREDLCNNINSKYDKRDCFTDIAVYKEDPAICANLAGNEANICYKQYSIDADDFDSCALITSDGESDECYIYFAVEDSNHELCGELNLKTNRDECYYGIALANTNSEFCESIEKDSKKEECYENIETMSEEEAGDCKYDSDCDAICEGDIKWKMGCDARTNTCIKTFDYDCKEQKEKFASYEFSMVCADGECVSNDAEIAAMKAELIALQAEISAEFKELNSYRETYKNEKYEAQNKCLDILSDVTNKFIIDSALKMGSVIGSAVKYISKGSDIISHTHSLSIKDDELTRTVSMSAKFTSKFTKDAAGYFGDYSGKMTDKLYKLTQAAKSGNEMTTEQAVEFYCGYNNYLSEVLDATAEQSENYQAASKLLREKINAFP
ncbi:MAG: hypothetical protein KAK00_02030 [Nanoarchaeota archaeon]|nr:hypothetical protein [Nanoarchaeota archaeon]